MTLPEDGDTAIGDVEVPPGRRVRHDPQWGTRRPVAEEPALWLTASPVPDAGARLIALRRQGGVLMPLLAETAAAEAWQAGEFSPGDVAGVDEHDAAGTLGAMWHDAAVAEVGEEDDAGHRRQLTDPYGTEFPGLAAPGERGQQPPSGLRRILSRGGAFSEGFDGMAWRNRVAPLRELHLGVVAAARPADVITLLGWDGAVNVHSGPAPMSAVLRSWEDRFAAQVVVIGPDTLTLVVDRPPRTLEHAFAIAAEHLAFCPDNVMQGPGTLRAYAPLLVNLRRWDFWWD